MLYSRVGNLLALYLMVKEVSLLAHFALLVAQLLRAVFNFALEACSEFGPNPRELVVYQILEHQSLALVIIREKRLLIGVSL